MEFVTEREFKPYGFIRLFEWKSGKRINESKCCTCFLTLMMSYIMLYIYTFMCKR